MIVMKRTNEASPFEAYSRLLVQLHSLIAAGKGDDQESDEIRDLMDSLWYQFTDSELQLARQLSADLYLIDPAEAVPYPFDETYTPELSDKLSEFRGKNDFLGVLQLLSTCTHEIGARRAFNVIASCYYHLGLLDVSLLFANRAVAFATDEMQGRFSLLLALIRADKRERAVLLAREMLREPGTLELNHRLFCATVILGESHGHDEDIRAQFIKEAMSAFEAILELLRTRNGKLTLLRVDCMYFMGECAYLLGNTDMAIQFLDQAIAENPEDEKSLVLRGLLKLRRDSTSAMKDFVGAIHAGTQAVQAYYYVAHDALASEDYEKCISTAGQGLRLASDSVTSAQLHELIALALIRQCDSFQDLPMQDVRRHIRYAMELDPFNGRYAELMCEFEEFVGKQNIPTPKIPKAAVKGASRLKSRADEYLQGAFA